jgi:hypothetical protein
VALVATAVLATFVAGVADEQLAKSNPRDYDFRAALQTVRREARPGDTLLYAPVYLNDVIEYYAPGIRARVIGARRITIPHHGRVFVLASFLDQPGIAGYVGGARYALAHSRVRLVSSDHLEKIYLWEYR